MSNTSTINCIAVRHHTSGPCEFRVHKDGLCKLHYHSEQEKGPKEAVLSRMYMTYINECTRLEALSNSGEDVGEEMAVLKARHDFAYYRMKVILSMSPNTKSDANYNLKKDIRAERKAFRRRQREQRHAEEADAWFRRREVAFHEDNQNVHREVTVNEVVKKTIEKVITIPVPAEYRWNMETVAKTPGEIIAECKLSIAAGKLLMEKYTSPETIYDMVPGIYGKTLDSVWQYIKAHSDKEVLIKTLKTELEDNVSMCAQGNLTRLCNVLQGYLDEMPAPSVAEILGDLLPPLMHIEDPTVRREKALQIMRTHNVPEDQHASWLAGMDVDDTYEGDEADELRREYLDEWRDEYPYD